MQMLRCFSSIRERVRRHVFGAPSFFSYAHRFDIFRHAIYFDGFVGRELSGARGLIAVIRNGLDSHLSNALGRSVWIERVRKTEALESSRLDPTVFLATNGTFVERDISPDKYIKIMAGGTRSVDTFSFFDALGIAKALRRNGRTDVRVSLTVLDVNQSNDQCFEFWSSLSPSQECANDLEQLFLKAESLAFQTVPVWIFANKRSWVHYKKKHADLEIWSKTKKVYFYGTGFDFQDETYITRQYLSLVSRIARDCYAWSEVKRLSAPA